MTVYFIASGEFDQEVSLRLESDMRLAGFSGQPLDVDNRPSEALPVYSNLIELIDLLDELDLFNAVARLDATKASRQTWYQGAASAMANPRRIRTDELIRVANLTNGEMLLMLAAEIGWNDEHSTSTLGLGTTEAHLPSGYAVTGGHVSMITIGRIAATFQVVGGVSLVGRRLKAAAPGSVPSSFVVKRRLVLNATGSDQTFTIQSGETFMDVECWGGGGLADGAAFGGAGGFTFGRFNVTTGQAFAAMVGEAGKASGSVYGFGGATSGSDKAGGGMSGVFTGSGTILVSDSSRALIIAGGGSGGQNDGSGITIGQHGNSVHAGVNSDFAGTAAGSGHSGGGGGYQGGHYSTNLGRNGLGYLHSSKTRGAILASSGSVAGDPAAPPPGLSSPNYVAPRGYAGQNGLIVVTISGPA